MSIRIFLSQRKVFLSLSSFAVLAIIAWFCAVTPKWQVTEIIHPDLYTEYQAPSSFVRNYNREETGLFWMKFTVAPQIFSLDRLRLRIWGCLDYITTNTQEWNLPSDKKILCDNERGMKIRQAAATFKEPTTWSFAGQTSGSRYGIYLEKDWSEPILIIALALMTLLLGGILYKTLPIDDKRWKICTLVIFGIGLGIRFYSVFIISPPQMNLLSDMAGYFNRANEILRGEYRLDQNFQPLGYTFWSLLLRKLGGWELLSWIQVFASWGTSILIFLVALEYFGLAAGLFSLILASIHFPQISFASYHLAESSYTFMLTLALWWILKTFKEEKPWKYFLTGVLLMVSFYFKGNHTFFVPIFSLWLLLRDRSEFKKAARNVAAMAAGCFIVMAPHLAWTTYAFGKPMAGPSAGALNFVEGKCPWKDNKDSVGNSWMSPLFSETGEKTSKKWSRPFTDQAYFWKEGFKCVQENPKVMLTSMRYIYYLFAGNELWPAGFNRTFSTLYKSWKPIYFYLLLPMSLLGFILLFRGGGNLQKVFIMMLLSVFLTVYIFKSENRFRVPFDMILIIWGGYAMSWLLVRVRGLFNRKIEVTPLADYPESNPQV